MMGRGAQTERGAESRNQNGNPDVLIISSWRTYHFQVIPVELILPPSLSYPFPPDRSQQGRRPRVPAESCDHREPWVGKGPGRAML